MDLPKWLTRRDDGAYVIDPDLSYPAILEALALPVDQYALEVAYQCGKLRVQEIASVAGDAGQGKTLTILIGSGKDKAKWALSSHGPGKGAAAATRGREAREHFERIRGKF